MLGGARILLIPAIIALCMIFTAIYFAIHHLNPIHGNRPSMHDDSMIIIPMLKVTVDSYVAETASAILNASLAERVVYYDDSVVLEPGAIAEIRYRCPIGVAVHVHVEPDVEVEHRVGDEGVCALLVRNNLTYTVAANIAAYSNGLELAGDPAFRTYVVFRWVSENLRYIEDPSGLDIVFKPSETLRRGGGDCEDLALATAALLRALNVSADIALVNTGYSAQIADHAAVAVKPPSTAFVHNLMVYFGAPAMKCHAVVVRGYVILDPVLAVSSAAPLCVQYRDIRYIITDNRILKAG